MIDLKELSEILVRSFPPPIRVGRVPSLNNYKQGTLAVFYAIFPLGTNSLAGNTYDIGRTACIIISNNGIWYELNETYGNFWPIIYPRRKWVRLEDAAPFLEEIKHFLTTGEVRRSRLHKTMTGGTNSRIYRAFDAQHKCHELEAAFPGLKTGGAYEG
jgi:hypothetical protein